MTRPLIARRSIVVPVVTVPAVVVPVVVFAGLLATGYALLAVLDPAPRAAEVCLVVGLALVGAALRTLHAAIRRETRANARPSAGWNAHLAHLAQVERNAHERAKRAAGGAR